MPGALKAGEADGGGAVEMSTRLVRAKKVLLSRESRAGLEIDVLNSGGKGGELSKDKRKKRQKRRKLSSPTIENERAVDEPLDRIVQDAIDLGTPFRRHSHSNGCFSKAVEQNKARECSSENGVEEQVSVKLPGSVKVNKKKRKHIEEERLKETNETVSSSVVATEATTVEVHDRVWQYVCNRAVLVDSESIRDSVLETELSADQTVRIPHSRYWKNTVITEIRVAGKIIVVTNTKEGAVAQAWLSRQKGTVFGLDAEWRPSFRKGTEHKVALLQICGESECLIVQMLYLDAIPSGLVNFLKDPTIKFPGVGVQGDAVKLKRDWGLECNGAVDLTSLAAKTLGRPELKAAGLKALAKIVMDYDMAKPKRVTMSNWAKPVLDKVQVEYASLDAWVSYAIHQKLYESTLPTAIDFLG